MTTQGKIAVAAAIVLCVAGDVLRRTQRPTGQLTAIVVEDSTARTPAIGQVLASSEVAAAVAKYEILWRVLPIDATGPDLKAWQWAIDEARKGELPALILRRGGRVCVMRLPAAAAETAALLAMWAGESGAWRVFENDHQYKGQSDADERDESGPGL